ncbi:MAG: hypothetical protein JWQ22_2929 [Devosia sp.]|nr:hypothetical protein [Devosia sp.]
MIRTALHLAIFSILVLGGSALAEDAAPAGVLRTFGDWDVTCDNAHNCWAQTTQPLSGTGTIGLRRDAGAQAQPHVSLTLHDGTFDEAAFDETGFEAVFTGGDFEDEFGPRLTIADDKTALFVAALNKATTLSIPVEDEVIFSLAGSSAALRFIDEVQGRADTITALIAKGDKPASAVPAPLPLPIIAAPPTAVVLIDTRPVPTLAKAGAIDCTEEQEYPFPGFVAEGYRLPDGREIWFMPCFSGPYNYVSTAYLKTGEAIAPLPFSGPKEGGPPSDLLTQLWNAALNVEGKDVPLTLSTFGKNRGMGDCGTITEHVWTGTRFALTKYLEMEGCSGLWEEADWPVRWQAEIAAQ